MSFQTKPYKLFKLDSGPNNETTLTKEDALKFYRQMQVFWVNFIGKLEFRSFDEWKQQLEIYTKKKKFGVFVIYILDK